MSRFDSAIGGRSFQGKQLKEFDVPDGENEFSELDVNQAINSGQLKRLNQEEIDEFQQRLNSVNVEEEEDYRPTARQAPRQAPPQRRPNPVYNDEIEEIEKSRQSGRKGIDRLSTGAKKRIEMLIGITRNIRQITIDGTTFTLQTLLSKEMREAISLSAEFDGNVESPFEIRTQFLARSISQIDNISIEQFIGSNQIEDKLAFIGELDDIFLNRLYEEYLILTKEAKQKYSISTKSEAEEVSEDLKK